ncbi:hypothetical protein [Lacinutrix mariniflava]|uniref:hypothetical protein n=1 Tax=Lacinutrix mariniflava TaxID=342955 RepID=UPI0006E152FE|nr:hypothetical protein [Lacinutrix mariniflava]
MKNSILIIATVVFSFLNVNAKTVKTTLNTETRLEIARDEIVQIFDWSVKTTTGDFSGTASTLLDAKRRANMVGQGAIVLEQKITNYFVLKSDIKSQAKRVYYWEVKSERGYAKGYSTNEFSAKKMMHLVAKGEIVSYRIIESKNM